MKRHFTAAVASAVLSVAVVAAPTLIAAPALAAETETQVLSSGSWEKKSFKVAGDWEIVQKGDKRYIRFSDDFKTKNAPDLKIFLSPTSAADAGNKNATDGSLLIAPLASNKGGQEYEIPADVDLADYQSILIHCEQYSKLWSAGVL